MESYKEVKKSLIHPWEKTFRFMNVTIFVVFFIGTLLVGGYVIENPEALESDESMFALAGIGIILLIIYFLGVQYAKTRANSIKITEKQFPEVYEVIRKFSEKLEMEYVPEAYVVQEGGMINAFATSFFSRKYISINSSIFEVAYINNNDMDTLSFVVGHELAHLKRKHATTLFSILESVAGMIPVWGPLQSRAKEYTCDRHAAWLAPEGIDGMMILSAGKYLYKKVDVGEYLENSKNFKGFFAFLHNIQASHPPMPKRIKALKNLEKRGKLF